MNWEKTLSKQQLYIPLYTCYNAKNKTNAGQFVVVQCKVKPEEVTGSIGTRVVSHQVGTGNFPLPERAASALNCWVISPATFAIFYYRNLCFKWIKHFRNVGQQDGSVDEALTANPADLSSTPRTYMPGEDWLWQVILWTPQVHCGMCGHSHTNAK